MTLKNIKMNLWPGGKNKALTFSYDDGKEQDRRLVGIMDKYGIRGSFHLNSGRLDNEEALKSSEVKELFQNHEVSLHTVTHPFLEDLPATVQLNELIQDRLFLEGLVDYPVRGMSYPNGAYSPEVIDNLKACGIRYCRTTISTDKFNVPKKFLEWHATCHHASEHLTELGAQFLEIGNNDDWRSTRRLNLFYLWGHSYEFDFNLPTNNWNIIEDFCKQMGNHDDIWYATNIEIYDYHTALKRLEFSCNNSSVYNPSALELWFEYDDKEIISIKPGETLVLK